MMIAMATALVASSAQAGPAALVVRGADPAPQSGASKVVVVVEATRQTYTIAVEYLGQSTKVGMLVPVPPGIDPGTARLLDPVLVDELDWWTSSRIRSAGPSGELWTGGVDRARGCSSGVSDSWTPVHQDATWLDATYEVLVVSNAQLDGWLSQEGLTLNSPTAEQLDPYRLEGRSFVAVTAEFDSPPENAGYLRPVQMAWDAPQVTLTPDVGIAASPGRQELELTVITPNGQAGLTSGFDTYLRDDCLYDPDRMGTPAELHAAVLDDAFRDEDLAWVTESFTDDAVRHMEFIDRFGMTDPSSEITRLRLRYDADLRYFDPILAFGGDQPVASQGYIWSDPTLQGHYPECCAALGDDEPCATDEVRYCSTSGSGPPALPLVFLAALAVVRRRR